jgi:hypothetical protein
MFPRVRSKDGYSAAIDWNVGLAQRILTVAGVLDFLVFRLVMIAAEQLQALRCRFVDAVALVVQPQEELQVTLGLLWHGPGDGTTGPQWQNCQRAPIGRYIGFKYPYLCAADEGAVVPIGGKNHLFAYFCPGLVDLKVGCFVQPQTIKSHLDVHAVKGNINSTLIVFGRAQRAVDRYTVNRDLEWKSIRNIAAGT